MVYGRRGTGDGHPPVRSVAPSSVCVSTYVSRARQYRSRWSHHSFRARIDGCGSLEHRYTMLSIESCRRHEDGLGRKRPEVPVAQRPPRVIERNRLAGRICIRRGGGGGGGCAEHHRDDLHTSYSLLPLPTSGTGPRGIKSPISPLNDAWLRFQSAHLPCVSGMGPNTGAYFRYCDICGRQGRRCMPAWNGILQSNSEESCRVASRGSARRGPRAYRACMSTREGLRRHENESP